MRDDDKDPAPVFTVRETVMVLVLWVALIGAASWV